MNQTEEAAKYRKKILFPMAFAWFDGYNNLGNIKAENREFADVSEWLIYNILSKQNVYSWTRMYEKEGHFSTKYENDIPLSNENLKKYWQEEGYGIVYWGGHGLPDGVVRTIWAEDANKNELAENEEVVQKDLIKRGDFKTFSGTNPAFVIALSCLVGEVSSPGNLSYDMLLNGVAVGVISSTFVDSPSYNTKFEDFDSPLSDKDYTLDLIGIHTIDRMIKGTAPSVALSDLRSEIGTSDDWKAFDHKIMMHYYGDPTLTLGEKAAETPDAEPADDNEPAADNEIEVDSEPSDSSNDSDISNTEDDSEVQINKKSKSSGCSVILL